MNRKLDIFIKYSISQKINQGEVVSVTGEASADWYTVTYNGKNGFIMKEFLVKV